MKSPDHLHQVREQIKRLTKIEANIRAKILSDDANLFGDTYNAAVSTHNVEQLDTKAVIEHFGRAKLRRFLKSNEVTRVLLTERTVRAFDSNSTTDINFTKPRGERVEVVYARAVNVLKRSAAKRRAA